MRKILNISLLSAIVLILSCQKSDSDEQVGYLSVVDLEISSDLNTRSDSDTPLAVTIYSSDGSIHSEYESHLELPDKISLIGGDYTILASNAQSDSYAQFDTPIYSGSKEFTISANEVSQISLTASHLSVLVEASFSEKMISTFKSISLSVSNGTSSLVYDGDGGSIGYFSVPKDGMLSYTLTVVNSSDQSYVVTGQVEDTEAKDLVNLSFDVDELDDMSDDNAAFKILVDESVNEIVREESLTPNRASIPTITSQGLDINSDIELDLGVATEFLLSVEAEGGLESVELRLSSDYFTQMGIPAQISIVNLSESDKALLGSVGITASSISEGDTSAEIDLGEMTGLLPVDESGSMSHDITLVVIDEQLQSSRKSFTINVADNTTVAEVATSSYTASSDYIWVTGKGQSTTKFTATLGYGIAPEGMGFMYRKQGSSEWITVTDISYTDGAKSYSATVSLDLKSTYEYKAISDSSEGSIALATTTAPMIPNLDFEDWYLVESTSSLTQDTWYPAADSESTFWVSGNPGVTGIGSNEESTTTPETSHVVSGTAAKMVSISGVTLVNFAAGNLYTGEFILNMAEPRESAVFGREYEGRPTRLVGYYDYTSSPIDTHYLTDDVSEELYAQHAGEDDLCHIYITLERWGSGVTSRPSDPELIGYGELKSSSTNGYQEFSIDIEYSSLELPDHISIVATSSYMGSDFVGGSSSVLYIDEFDLEFD